MKRWLEYVQFKGLSPESVAIQKFTRSDTSHSAVLDREAPTDKILIEQWPHAGGVKSWMDFNYFNERGGHTKGTPYEILSLPVESEDYNWIMDFYRQSAYDKKPYDWAGILAFITKGKGDQNCSFCSEEMVTPLVRRFDNWKDINPDVVHPGLFGDLLKVAGAKVTQENEI